MRCKALLPPRGMATTVMLPGGSLQGAVGLRWPFRPANGSSLGQPLLLDEMVHAYRSGNAFTVSLIPDRSLKSLDLGSVPTDNEGMLNHANANRPIY